MQCHCQQPMGLLLRTLLFSQKITVHYVPVHTCASCNRSEVHAAVKPQLKQLIKEHMHSEEKKTLYFHDVNEFAKLLFRASSTDFDNQSVDDIIHMRINELLDMLLLAESINDHGWVDEIHDRLDQINEYTRELHEWN